MTEKLTAERLRDLLSYDAATGLLRWRVRNSNRIAIGAIAGRPAANGYLYVGVDGKIYLAHRLAWLHVNGEWPKQHLDHIDGNPANNSISNLRECCDSRNGANAKRRRDNTSGFKGVSYRKDTGKYAAYLMVQRKRKSLGCYDTAEMAHDAYRAAAVQAFGEFARP